MKTDKPDITIYIFALLLLSIFSCRQGTEEQKIVTSRVDSSIYADTKDIKLIFYDMSSPVDAHRLFRQLDIVFDPSILNPPDNFTKYSTASKIAVNLGIFGANMSFCHMFGQTQEAFNYLSAIHKLAENLGISHGLISMAGDAVEKLINSPDSLAGFASQLYTSVDRNLLEHGKSGAASLIIAGGWIEALYIACCFHDYSNPEKILEEHILTQKYSLDRLVTMLSNHQNDDMVSKYLLMIRQLKRIYDNIEILYEIDDLSIDVSRKTIEAGQPQFNYSENEIDQIVKMVSMIRHDMVN
jgi:hypothetical protein